MIMKKTKWLSLLLVIALFMTTMSSVQAADITVEIIKNDPSITLSDEGDRVFEIGYEFEVDFEALATGLDLVLVLDRSNSMLRTDPSTGLPVADAVWDAVNEFITEYYGTYPNSNVAVVSFGTNGNKSDNWKYFNELGDTLEEIEEVYDYRDLYSNYRRSFRSYWNNGYRYAWENWQISDGATNISAAFEYAATTVDHKQVFVEANGQDVILLFTDGVATQGGSNSQKNYNYPTSHNTNTIAAYQSGIEAQEVAEVITVGYFEGLDYESTKEVARETLELSQNAGFFEASQTGQLTSIFETVVEELNYVGSDAIVTETVEDEFDVVEGSIVPDASSVTIDSEGRTVITWDLGNVIDETYSFGYQVQVKDDVYPTGSGTVMIPINLDAQLTYTDLDGNQITENLGHNETVIPPRSNQPLLEVAVDYSSGYDYLVGDTIHLDHDLTFINELPFDYREILVRDLVKTISGGEFGLGLGISETSLSNGWTLDGSELTYNIQALESTDGSVNLAWNDAIALELLAAEEGTYGLGYNVDYQLTNSAALAFEFISTASDPASINVRTGELVLNLRDNYGAPITDVSVINDGVEMSKTIVGDQIVLTGLTTGSHNITFQVPSGYEYLSGDSGMVLVEDHVAFTESFDYDQWYVEKSANFERLNIKEISVTDRSGGGLADVEAVDDEVDALVNFTFTVPLSKVEMRLTDDYDAYDHNFTLDQVGGYGHVEDIYGNQINGFSMVNGLLSYDGPILSAQSYIAYGLVEPPSNFGQTVDYDFEVYVDQIITREGLGDSEVTNTITSKELMIQLIDNQAPIIEPTINEDQTTTNLANYDIRIMDKVQIIDIKVYEGIYTLETLGDADEALAYTEIPEGELGPSLWQYTEDINCGIELEFELSGDKWLSSGDVTIYAKDAFGNEGVKVIEIDSEDVNDLLNGNIK